MPAEAGIQSGADINNFKDLDSRSLLKTCRDRFRGNDSVFPITTQSRGGEGKGEGADLKEFITSVLDRPDDRADFGPLRDIGDGSDELHGFAGARSIHEKTFHGE
jgi:hypothetical protein